ncbi:hypothetical protein K1719_024112 [Acacia pycnantha]|nr:hypothetical protein K1719_024112 [Acacia pycnantha]
MSLVTQTTTSPRRRKNSRNQSRDTKEEQQQRQKPWRHLNLLFVMLVSPGIGLEKPNDWAFDTTQFDNILKRLKVQGVQSNGAGLEKKTTKVETKTGVVVIILIQFLKLLDLKEESVEIAFGCLGWQRRCCIATFGALNVEYLFQVNFAVASYILILRFTGRMKTNIICLYSAYNQMVGSPKPLDYKLK